MENWRKKIIGEFNIVLPLLNISVKLIHSKEIINLKEKNGRERLTEIQAGYLIVKSSNIHFFIRCMGHCP